MWAWHAVTSPGGPLTQAEAHAFLGAVCAAALPRLVAGGHYPAGTDAASWASALYHDLFVDTGDMDAATGDRPLGPALAGRRRLLRRAGGAGDDVHGEQLLCGGGGVAGGVPGQDGERAPVVCHH